MPYEDMREFIASLEGTDQLRHVSVEVDKDWEISTIARRLFLERPAEKRPALVFDKVKGFDIPVAVSILGNRRRYALALGTNEDKIIHRWYDALEHPQEPVMVKKAPCQENLWEEDEVNLFRLPIPIWTPPKDVGPYITSGGCVTRDPETGIRNVGTYRLQLKGKNKTGIFFATGQHIATHYRKYEKLGQPMEIAVVLGSDPYVEMAQVTKVPLGVDEYFVAGGLKGKPLKLVKCKTIDLEVPATSEIVLEGVVPPGVREPEAPFGETSGFMSPLRSSPVIEVKAITFRNQPIYHCFISQKPPSESTLVKTTGAEGAFFWALKKAGVPGIKDLYCTEAGSHGMYVVVAIDKEYAAQPKQIFNIIWGTQPGHGKYIVVCDDDIDIRDHFQVEWALSYRCDPARDVTIVSQALGPEIDPASSHQPVSGKMGLDATIKKREDYDLALPDKEYFDRVLARWREYGLE